MEKVKFLSVGPFVDKETRRDVQHFWLAITSPRSPCCFSRGKHNGSTWAYYDEESLKQISTSLFNLIFLFGWLIYQKRKKCLVISIAEIDNLYNLISNLSLQFFLLGFPYCIKIWDLTIKNLPLNFFATNCRSIVWSNGLKVR